MEFDNRSFLPLVRRLKEKHEVPGPTTCLVDLFGTARAEEVEKVRCSKCGKKLKPIPRELHEKEEGEDTLWVCSTQEDNKIGHEIIWASSRLRVEND